MKLPEAVYRRKFSAWSLKDDKDLSWDMWNVNILQTVLRQTPNFDL